MPRGKKRSQWFPSSKRTPGKKPARKMEAVSSNLKKKPKIVIPPAAAAETTREKQEKPNPRHEEIMIDRESLVELSAHFDPSVVPVELPCRDKEITEIQNFVENNIKSGTSGCIYVSGVPGIGKTASVRLAIQKLLDNNNRRKSPPDFIFLELNGMSISDPKRIFVEFYKGLLRRRGDLFECTKNGATKNNNISPAFAARKLETLFSLSDRERPSIVLLLDEIDALVNKRQQHHLYRLLEWSTRDEAKLSLISIANTLDLPERLLSHRNQSRMGMKRLCFRPYNYADIKSILTSRLLKASKSSANKSHQQVEEKATELIARKVASVSGDVRRAFEVLREAIGLVVLSDESADGVAEISAKTTRKRKRQDTMTLTCGPVTTDHVLAAFKKMSTNVKVQAIKNASTHEQLLMKAAVKEYRRCGIEEMSLERIWRHYRDDAIFEEDDDDNGKVDLLSVDQLLDVANRLRECGLLVRLSSTGWQEDFTAKYRLNVNPDDVDLAVAAEEFTSAAQT